MIKYLLALPALFLAPILGAQITAEALDSQGLNLQLSEVGLNLRIVDQNFRIYFFDEDRLPLNPPPYAHAVLFTEEVSRPKREDRIFLSPSADGPFLVSPRIIAPPYDFWVRIVLSDEEDENTTLPRTRFQQEIPEELKDDDGEDPVVTE